MRGEIHDAHAFRLDDLLYIATAKKVISAPRLLGLEHFNENTFTIGVIIFGGKSISDEAILAARDLVEYRLLAKPEWHSITRIIKMHMSLL